MQFFVVIVFIKLIGFIREVVFGVRFGISVKVDVFFFVLQFLNIFFVFIFAVFLILFILFYIDICEKKGEDEGIKFINSVINILFFVLSIVVIFGFIFLK